MVVREHHIRSDERRWCASRALARNSRTIRADDRDGLSLALCYERDRLSKDGKTANDSSTNACNV